MKSWATIMKVLKTVDSDRDRLKHLTSSGGCVMIDREGKNDSQEDSGGSQELVSSEGERLETDRVEAPLAPAGNQTTLHSSGSVLPSGLCFRCECRILAAAARQAVCCLAAKGHAH